MKKASFILYSSLIGFVWFSGQGAIFSEKNTVQSSSVQIFSQAETTSEIQNLEKVNVQYRITHRWNGKYRIEIIMSGNGKSDRWQAGIVLPKGHRITENYGVLISQGSERVNFAGDEWNSSLSREEETLGVLVVEGDPQEAQISFDDYFPNLGEPIASSFTEQERQQFRAKYTVESEEEEETLTEEPDIESEEEEETLTEEPDIESKEEEETLTEEPDIESEEEEETLTEEPDIESEGYENYGTSTGSGQFNYVEALQKNWLFYMANRSGEMGKDNILPWRSNSTMKDGSDVGKDLTGGYFDAGDHIKFIQTTAFSMNLLAWSGVDYKDAYNQSGQADELLAAVKWGTDYLLKSHEFDGSSTSRLWVQVGDATDHYHWVAPEKIDQVTNRPSFAIDPSHPGSDVAAATASAFASASMLFGGIDDAYSDELLKNAIVLYDFAENHLGKYSDSVDAVNPFYTSWSGYEDELVLGAIWLYRATGEAKYLTKAENYFRQGIGHIGTYTYVPDDSSYAALAMLAKESSDPFFKQEFNGWANYWLNAEGGVKHSADGFAIRAEWASAPLALGASYLLEWYSDFVESNPKYSAFAQKQVDYVLGNNSRNFSYVIGFGENYPLRPHHRGSAGSQKMDAGNTPNDHLLVGALVGGPRSDDNSHEDRRDDWVTNEVGISYNAPLAASTIQQEDNFKGKPLSDAELLKIKGVGQNK